MPLILKATIKRNLGSIKKTMIKHNALMDRADLGNVDKAFINTSADTKAKNNLILLSSIPGNIRGSRWNTVLKGKSIREEARLRFTAVPPRSKCVPRTHNVAAFKLVADVSESLGMAIANTSLDVNKTPFPNFKLGAGIFGFTFGGKHSEPFFNGIRVRVVFFFGPIWMSISEKPVPRLCIVRSSESVKFSLSVNSRLNSVNHRSLINHLKYNEYSVVSNSKND